MHKKEDTPPPREPTSSDYVAPDVNGLRMSQMVPGVGGTPSSFQVHHQAALQFKTHRGPLPAAEDLQKYADISPEVLGVILSMAKQNNETQNVTRKREQTFTFFGDISKTISGLIFGLCCLFAAYQLAMHDHPYTAGVLGTTTLLIGVSVLVMRVAPKGKFDSLKPPPEATHEKI